MSNLTKQSLIPGVQNSGYEIEMGVKESIHPFEKYSGSKNNKDIITVLSKNPILIRSHYTEDIGYRFHFLPEAQAVGIPVDMHYAFLAVRWGSGPDGLKVLDPMKYEFVALIFGPGNYTKLVDKFNVVGDLSKVYLQVITEDEKFKNYRFEKLETPSHLWQPEYAALLQEISQKFQEYKPVLPKVAAATLSPELFKQKMAEKGAATASPAEQRSFDAAAQVAADTNVLNPATPPADFGALGAGVQDAQIVSEQAQPAATNPAAAAQVAQGAQTPPAAAPSFD